MPGRKLLALAAILVLAAVLASPLARADDTNLGAIPNRWDYNYTGMRGINCPTSPGVTLSTYGGNPAIRIQSGIVDSNPSLQSWDSPAGYFDPETDTAFYSVNAGDHIYFTADVSFTAIDSSRSGSLSYGAIIGFDYYGADGRIQGMQTPDGSPTWTVEGGWSSESVTNIVTSGESRQITINAVVPSTIEYDGFGTIVGSYTPNPGTPEVPTSFTAWLFIYAFSGESAYAYFSNIQLYINPSGTLTPPPTSSPTQGDGSGGSGGSGGGWSVINPTASPAPTSTAKGLSLQSVADAWNSIGGGGKLFLLVAVGAVAFIFAGKKR